MPPPLSFHFGGDCVLLDTRRGREKGVQRDGEQASGSNRFRMVTRGQYVDEVTRRLLRAVLRGDTNGVKEALRDGGRPEEGAPEADALMMAAALGHVGIVDLLLEAGASVAASGVDGHTALSVTADCGRSTIVKRLVDAGASVSVRTSTTEDTPLHRFVAGGHVEGSKGSAWFRCFVESDERVVHCPTARTYVLLHFM